MEKRTLIKQGNFYKGNTHTHTNLSDGKMTPAEAKTLYKDNGYSFIAITDHRVYGVHEELNDADFLILPGVEIDSMPEAGYEMRHVVGLGIPKKNKFPHGHRFDYPYVGKTVQELIDMLRENGNHAIIAHPAWSYLDFPAVLNAKNHLGMEVYNNICELGRMIGDSSVYFEKDCMESKASFCFASDDIHGTSAGEIAGFIGVKAKSLTHADIIAALERGSFYASNGPEIYDFYVKDGVAYAETSPVSTMSLLTDSVAYGHMNCGAGITSTAWEIKEFGAGFRVPTMIRLVAKDSAGRKAFSQRILL